MGKFVGVIASGSIGRDPFNPRSWSGSSHQFFNHCNDAGILHRALGCEVDKHNFIYHALMNFSFERSVMRNKLYYDPAYLNDLTQKVKRLLRDDDYSHFFLQIGAIVDLPSIVKGRSKCVSYNDGNIIQKIRSPYFDERLKKYALRSLEFQKHVNSSLDKVFTFSEYLKHSFVEDFGLQEKNVVCIGTGANLPTPSSCPVKDNDNTDIIFLGVDFERKGGEILIDAFLTLADKHKNARVIIIGPKKVPKKIVDNPHERIKFIGFLSKSIPTQLEQLLYWLNRSRIGVLPSYYEPFGLSVIECQLHGMPVVAIDSWAFPEMISNGVTGFLISRHSSADLADVLDYYLSHPEVMTSQGEAAHHSSSRKYGWDKVAIKLRHELELLA
jgi:glycosyltransferase involved in cell wall biosynthesis